jgi:hypothetical protein
LQLDTRGPMRIAFIVTLPKQSMPLCAFVHLPHCAIRNCPVSNLTTAIQNRRTCMGIAVLESYPLHALCRASRALRPILRSDGVMSWQCLK